MTGLEGETTVIGCFLLAGEIVYLGFLAVKRHYFKGSISLGFTAPDSRYPKPLPAPAVAPAEVAVKEPVPLERRAVS